MLDKLNIVQQKFNEVSDLIIQPNIISDQKRYISLNKEYKELGMIIDKKKLYEELLSNINEAQEKYYELSQRVPEVVKVAYVNDIEPW